ncbi:MAG: MATE family efflux transporter [Geminicoccaceae bacterium]
MNDRSAHKEAWHLAWPLILSNITVPLLGMVDTAVVGHLPGPHHLGAVALGASAFNALFFTVVSLRMGTTGLIAQAFGAGDRVEIEAVLLRALALAILLAGLMILLTTPIIDAANWIFSPTERVSEGLEIYLKIRLYAAPAALANMVVLGWLLGMQDARSPLYLMILGNGLNMALDVLFVFGFGWEVAGVAFATVIAEYASLALGAWLVWRRLGGFQGGLGIKGIMAWRAIRRLIAVNRDIVLRSLTLQVAFVSLAALGSRQGEVVLAANTVLAQMNYLSAFALDGFAFAASTLVGRHAGARDRPAMRAAVIAGLHWSLVFALAITLIFAFGGGILIAVITDIEAVRATALVFLPYAVVSPLIGAVAFLFDGVYIGATRTAEMRNGMVVAVIMFGAVAWLLMPLLGNHGLWLAYLVFMIVRGLWLGIVYWRLEAGAGFMNPASPSAADRSA